MSLYLILADVSVPLAVGIAAGAAIVAAGLAAVVVRAMGSTKAADAKRQADELLRSAQGEAANIRKQAELEAQRQVVTLRQQFEKETDGERNELREEQRRLTKREDNLDRKLDTLGTKEKFLEDLDAKIKKREAAIAADEAQGKQLLQERKDLIESTRQEQKQILMRTANLNMEDARREALELVQHELQHETGVLVQQATARAEEEAKDVSLKIVLQAIQRYASEHTAATTVNAVPIPSDDLKGRVIGREGRNIRAFEKATGVDVIVDDTPGVIVVSCFDPVRRAIAAESLQRLIEDGRIHPARIEELVEQTTKDVQHRIIKFGRDASIEVNLPGLHPKINEMMGRLHYRTSYGQNILRHSVETAFISQIIADELGLNGELARRCGYLHDIGKAMDHDTEGGHPAIGADFAKKFNEREEVLNAIAGHHNDIPATSPYTPIVMAADAISGARPGARRETLEKYIKRLEQLEGIATSMKGVRQAYAIQAGREVRVIVDPENVDDATCAFIARDIAKRVSEEMTFPGEIRITVLREMRTVEYAR